MGGKLLATLAAMLADLSDEELMLRYCAGDFPAFEYLYERHYRGLYRFLAWRSPRRDWVDEIAQDSWISLHRARMQYQPHTSFRAYLYQIARNRLIDLLRQPQVVLAADMGAGVEGESVFTHLVDAAQQQNSPELALESRQRITHLHAAIHALPGEQKEVLILQQFNGMSLEDIAQLVDVPVETVKSRLRYAMQKLRLHYTQGPTPKQLALQEEQT